MAPEEQTDLEIPEAPSSSLANATNAAAMSGLNGSIAALDEFASAMGAIDARHRDSELVSILEHWRQARGRVTARRDRIAAMREK